MSKSCNICTHYSICSTRLAAESVVEKMVAIDRHRKGNVLTRFKSVLGEECVQFVESIVDQSL